MIKTDNLVEGEDGYLSVTSKCAFNVEMLENDLPITIREKSGWACGKNSKAWNIQEGKQSNRWKGRR